MELLESIAIAFRLANLAKMTFGAEFQVIRLFFASLAVLAVQSVMGAALFAIALGALCDSGRKDE